MRRHFLILPLLMLLSVSLMGCERDIVLAEPSQVQETGTVAVKPVTLHPDMSDTEQIRYFIAQSEELGLIDEDTQATLTDLDGNGRLELILASKRGVGIATKARIFELDSDWSRILEVLIVPEGAELPDLITETVNATGADPSRNYLFPSSLRSDSIVTEKLVSLRMNKGVIYLEDQYTKRQSLQNEIAIEDLYYDGSGTAIDDAAYRALVTELSNSVGVVKHLLWSRPGQDLSEDLLRDCYDTFILNDESPAGGIEEAKISTTPGSIQILKSPSSEELEFGDTCSFVARATGYTNVNWQLIDPSGAVYNAAETAYTTMKVKGQNTETLTLQNVPLDLNGWSVRAVYTNSETGASEITQAAKLAVFKRQTLRVSCTASPAGGTVFTTQTNAVTLVSSNGNDINYELYRQGEEKPYNTGTVGSGCTVTITGVAEQTTVVSIVASVVGGTQTFHFAYTVDCAAHEALEPSPIPVPVESPDTPEPTPIPQMTEPPIETEPPEITTYEPLPDDGEIAVVD